MAGLDGNAAEDGVRGRGLGTFKKSSTRLNPTLKKYSNGLTKINKY